MKAKKTASKKVVKKTTAPKKASALPTGRQAKKELKVSVKSVPSAKQVKAKAKDVKAVAASDATEKQSIIEKFAQKKGDTGSPEVQVALLSFKIGRLAEHLNQNKKDNHSRRGLLKVVAKRRRILNYLQKLDADRYVSLIGSLKLKK